MKEWKQEFPAALSVFLAASYIVIVNPLILSESGLPLAALTTSTIIITVVATLLMGFVGRNPYLIAPGMGLNAFFTYGVVKTYALTPEAALGLVFWSGVIFLLLCLTPLREWIIQSIPNHLRKALAGGIGLFLGLIGLKNAQLITSHPATLVSFNGQWENLLVFFSGFFLTAHLTLKKNSLALIFGIITSTVVFYLSYQEWPTWGGIIQRPDFSLFFAIDFLTPLKWASLPAMLTFFIIDMLDSLSTFVAVSEAGNRFDEQGNPLHLKRSLLSDALATIFAGLAGSSPATCFIESAAGTSLGAQTWRVNVMLALLFLPLLFLSPLLSLVPLPATSAALVIVGVFMMQSMGSIEWRDFATALPSFMAVVLIPMSFSIGTGIGLAYIMHWFILLITTSSQALKKEALLTLMLSLGMVISHG